VAHLAVREMPGSGTTAELLAEAGIDADAIAAAAAACLPSCCRSGPIGGGMAPSAMLNRPVHEDAEDQDHDDDRGSRSPCRPGPGRLDSSTPSDGWLAMMTSQLAGHQAAPGERPALP